MFLILKKFYKVLDKRENNVGNPDSHMNRFALAVQQRRVVWRKVLTGWENQEEEDQEEEEEDEVVIEEEDDEDQE